MSFLIWRSRTSILRCFVFSDTLCLLLGMALPRNRIFWYRTCANWRTRRREG